VSIEAAQDDAADQTVEQKLTAEAQRIAASIQVRRRCCPTSRPADAALARRNVDTCRHPQASSLIRAARASNALPSLLVVVQAAAAAMAGQIRDEWRTRRQELEAMLAC
jgi:hypothetical protein